jgi:hypothetical protein
VAVGVTHPDHIPQGRPGHYPLGGLALMRAPYSPSAAPNPTASPNPTAA